MAQRKGSFQKSERIVFSGKSIAVGMHWFISGRDEKRAVAKAASSCKASFGYKIHLDEKQLTGFYNGLKASNKLYAGAAVVASVYEEGIFILPCGSDKYWFLLISQGQPICGYDRIVDQDEAKTLLTQLRSIYAGLPLYADTHFIHTHMPDEKDYSGIVLDELLHIERLTSDFLLTRQVKKYVDYAPYIAVVGLLIAGGVFLVPKIFMSDTVANIQLKNAEEKWLSDAQWEKNTIINLYKNSSATYPIDSWISSLLEVINRTPLEAGGWYFSELDCQAKKKTCLIKWQNSGYGTFKSLNYTVGDHGSLEFVNPNLVNQTIEIISFSSESFTEQAIAKRIKQLPTLEEFQLEHVSVLQLLRTVPNLEFAIKSPMPGPRVSKAPPGVNRVISFPSFNKGTWEMSGRGINILIDSILKLDTDVYFGQALNIEVTYNKQAITAEWNVGGEYVNKS